MKGWLHRLHRGVYAVGHRPLTDEGRWMAAVLACGEGAVLSHQAAGELWGLRRRRKGRADRRDDSAERRAGGQRTGIAIHRVSDLAPGGAHSSLPDPCHHPRPHAPRPGDRPTPPSARAGHRRGRATEPLHRRRPGRDRECSLRSRRCRCAPRLLDEHRAGSTATRNEFEERFLTLCRSHRLPQPDVNVPLLDYVVDFLWATGEAGRRARRPRHPRHPPRLPGRPRPGRPPGGRRLPRPALHLVRRDPPARGGRRPRPADARYRA